MYFYKDISEIEINKVTEFPFCLLEKDGDWNDKGMITSFKLSCIKTMEKFEKYDIFTIGQVKISTENLRHDSINNSYLENVIRTKLPESPFLKLNETYFSLGQSQEYYANLMSLGDEVSKDILKSLNDIVFEKNIYEKYRYEPSMINSLKRNISDLTIRGQFKRIITGEAPLTAFNFSYQPKNSFNNQFMDFNIEPNSYPPSNIQVLIGKNGVGKTYLLYDLLKIVVLGKYLKRFKGTDDKISDTFSSVIVVSFSMFDVAIEKKFGAEGRIPFHYVGLNSQQEVSISSIAINILENLENNQIDKKQMKEDLNKIKNLEKNQDNISEYFTNSLINIKKDHFRFQQWEKSVNILEDEDSFKDLNIIRRADRDLNDKNTRKKFKRYFNTRLSSGHKIVLLIITKLSELIEEKTLVLFDEPENHLHPPLLALMFRAMNELLIYRNAVAIVTTHSPIVLQEVPKRSTWILRRSGKEMFFRRPNIETYGENTGTLNREVFKLDVLRSGYHTSILKSIRKDENIEDIYKRYNNELGSEARELIKAELFNKNLEEENF